MRFVALTVEDVLRRRRKTNVPETEESGRINIGKCRVVVAMALRTHEVARNERRRVCCFHIVSRHELLSELSDLQQQ